MTCRHCKRRKANSTSGLCRVCHDDPDVLAQYRRVRTCPGCGGHLADRAELRIGERCAYCLRGGRDDISPELAAKLRAVDALVASGRVGMGPTGDLPGTVAKVAVLCVRAARRLPLFHPNDAAGSDPRPGLW